MTEPMTAPRPGVDRTVLLAGGLVLLGVAGLAWVSMSDRAALRRATDDAHTITESLLDYAQAVRGVPVSFNTGAAAANGATPTATPNGHVAPAVPVGRPGPAEGTPDADRNDDGPPAPADT